MPSDIWKDLCEQPWWVKPIVVVAALLYVPFAWPWWIWALTRRKA